MEDSAASLPAEPKTPERKPEEILEISSEKAKQEVMERDQPSPRNLFAEPVHPEAAAPAEGESLWDSLEPAQGMLDEPSGFSIPPADGVDETVLCLHDVFSGDWAV